MDETMTKFLALLLAPLALAGCGADVAGACQNYFDAVNTCFTDYGDAMGVDMSGSQLSDTYCDDTYGGMTDVESADYLNCLADAYNATDCSDSDAYAAIDLTGCTME
jgi:hypothetical protein